MLTVTCIYRTGLFFVQMSTCQIENCGCLVSLSDGRRPLEIVQVAEAMEGARVSSLF
jgi:hypothetical protein